jgi:hypothetical protein
MNTSSADMDVGGRAILVRVRQDRGGGRFGLLRAEDTAVGVFHGIRAAVAHAFGSDDLDGRTVAVQGVGAVGEPLSRFLAEVGARLTLADVDDVRAKELAEELEANAVPADRIAEVECDCVLAVRDGRRPERGNDSLVAVPRDRRRGEQPVEPAGRRRASIRTRHPVRPRLRRERRWHDPPRGLRDVARGLRRGAEAAARDPRDAERCIRSRRCAGDLDRRLAADAIVEETPAPGEAS